MSPRHASPFVAGFLGLSLVSLSSISGCSGDDAPLGDSGTGVDTGPGVDTGATVDTGPPVDSGSPRDGGRTDSGTPDSGMSTSAVHFAVMGDVGTGSTTQREVAVVLRDFCVSEGCEFILLLGDNIYDSGVESINDDLWRTHFEEPYRDIDLPFYAVLGNHDYGGRIPIIGTRTGGLGNEFDRGPFEVAYTAESDKWEMPDTFYTFQVENVGFIGLDTNSILWDDTTHGDQWAWWPTALSEISSADWVIALGHHPYRSNGAHGNAGTYETIEIGGIDLPLDRFGIDALDGSKVEEFFDRNICGVADISFSGHDHNRQWIDEPGACGGTELVVSGAGAKTKGFDDPERNATHFQDDVLEGFMHVIIDGDTFRGRWINRDGVVEFDRMFTRSIVR